MGISNLGVNRAGQRYRADLVEQGKREDNEKVPCFLIKGPLTASIM